MEIQLNLKYKRIHNVPFNGFLAIFSKRLWHWNCRRYWRKALKEVDERLEELSWYSGVEKSEDQTIAIKYKMLKSRQQFLKTALGKNVCQPPHKRQYKRFDAAGRRW